MEVLSNISSVSGCVAGKEGNESNKWTLDKMVLYYVHSHATWSSHGSFDKWETAPSIATKQTVTAMNLPVSCQLPHLSWSFINKSHVDWWVYLSTMWSTGHTHRGQEALDDFCFIFPTCRSIWKPQPRVENWGQISHFCLPAGWQNFCVEGHITIPKSASMPVHPICMTFHRNSTMSSNETYLIVRTSLYVLTNYSILRYL